MSGARAERRTLVMGVVNVTPDSFSDGGRWLEPSAAVEHGLSLVADGADLVDVGGESTRPGSARPDADEELRRVIPVITELAAAGVRVSVDTMRAVVAERALEAGAALINDVSGGLVDDRMPSVAADADVPFVAMHWRGHGSRMDDLAVYDDVVADVCRELSQRVEVLLEAGLAREHLIVDPGFGFAKTAEHNWRLLRHLDAVQALGHPVLVGTSRKRFLGRLGPGADREDAPPRPPQERDAATAATSLFAARAGAWAVRVHDVRSTVDALAVAAALEAADD